MKAYFINHLFGIIFSFLSNHIVCCESHLLLFFRHMGYRYIFSGLDHGPITTQPWRQGPIHSYESCSVVH